MSLKKRMLKDPFNLVVAFILTDFGLFVLWGTYEIDMEKISPINKKHNTFPNQ